MINVHLNGDIVRCPNTREIQKRCQELRDQKRICVYNRFETQCLDWIIYKRDNHNAPIRCNLAHCGLCPRYKEQQQHGRKKKTYKINNQVYRKLSSSAHYMVKTVKYKTLFLSLTFPKFKKTPDEKTINECFSRFIHNLHENYDVKNYIAVKEHGSLHYRAHFHLLLDIKFVNFNYLNSAWCSAIKDICYFSKNALTSDKKTVIIRNPGKALRYCCKYFAKQRGSISDTRLVFMSMPLQIKPENDTRSVNDILKGFKSVYIQQTSDFTTCFRITDAKEFEQFCNLYLYSLFRIPNKKIDFTGLPGSLN